jgi:hypothetical protein
MWAWWRLLRPILQHRYTAPVTGGLSVLLLAGSLVGYVNRWAAYPTLLFWGLVWGITAVAAWAINR